MSERFEKPVLKRMRRPYLLIWLVPICAAVLTFLYLHDYFETLGADVTIQFERVEGLRVGDAVVMHHGVKVGDVKGIRLSEDDRRPLVDVKFDKRYASFARGGAAFWIVRPEVSSSGLTGFNAVFSGPYIEANPGSGEPRRRFTGLERAPEPPLNGMELVLTAPKVEHFQAGAPVLYRGLQVGAVRDLSLGPLADHVDVRIEIWPRYEKLVTRGSRFWMLTGLDVSGGLLTGLQFKLESLGTLLNGAVAFATPEKNVGPQAQGGDVFALEKEPGKDWQQWAPKIPIRP